MRALSFLMENGETLAQVAIRFAISKNEASTVLVGFSSMAQLEVAVVCSGKPGLSHEQREKLQHLYHAD